MNILTVVFLIIEILRKLHSYSLGVLKRIVDKCASIATSVILTATEEFLVYYTKVWESYPNDK